MWCLGLNWKGASAKTGTTPPPPQCLHMLKCLVEGVFWVQDSAFIYRKLTFTSLFKSLLAW